MPCGVNFHVTTIVLYKFVLTSFVIHAVMAFNPKTWKEIPKMVCERRKYAKQRR
jgi:hypothetical protein